METENVNGTGKSCSEALISASTKPQYDDRLFIELGVQYMKFARKEHVVYTNCFFVFLLTFRTITCSDSVLSSELAIFMY